MILHLRPLGWAVFAGFFASMADVATVDGSFRFLKLSCRYGADGYAAVYSVDGAHRPVACELKDDALRLTLQWPPAYAEDPLLYWSIRGSCIAGRPADVSARLGSRAITLIDRSRGNGRFSKVGIAQAGPPVGGPDPVEVCACSSAQITSLTLKNARAVRVGSACFYLVRRGAPRPLVETLQQGAKRWPFWTVLFWAIACGYERLVQRWSRRWGVQKSGSPAATALAPAVALAVAFWLPSAVSSFSFRFMLPSLVLWLVGIAGLSIAMDAAVRKMLWARACRKRSELVVILFRDAVQAAKKWGREDIILCRERLAALTRQTGGTWRGVLVRAVGRSGCTGRALVVLFSIAFVLLLVYLPALDAYYMYHDDHYTWAWKGKPWEFHPTYGASLMYGRPVTNWILLPTEMFIDRLSDANWVRRFNLACVVLLGGLLYRWFRRSGIKEAHSFFLVLILLTLPTVHIYIGYLIHDVLIGASFLAVTAAFASDNAADPSKGKTKRASWFFLSVASLIASLATYQPTAMLFVAMLSVPLCALRSSDVWKSWRRFVVWGATGMVAMLVYYVAYRLTTYEQLLRYEPHRVASVNFLDRLQWFFGEVLMRSASFWSLDPLPWAVPVVVAIGAAGMIAEVCATFRGKTAERWGPAAGAVLKHLGLWCLLPLSYAAILASGYNTVFYRTLLPIYFVLVVLLFHALDVILELFVIRSREAVLAGVLGMSALIGAAWAQHTMATDMAIPLTLEQRCLMAKIRRADMEPVRRIHVIRPRVRGRTSGDEYGFPNTAHPQDVPWVVKCALLECGITRPVEVTSGDAGSEGDRNADLLVIDMREILSLGYWKLPTE